MLSLAVAVQAAAVTAFSPPLDRPIDIVFVDLREDPGRTLRFEIRRRVTFRRAGEGFAAAVETLAVTDDAKGPGAMFAAMMRGLIGRTIVLRLDATGRVTDVDDLDRMWTMRTDAYAAGLARTVPKAAQAEKVAPIIAALRAAPRTERIARFAEMLVPLLADLPLNLDGERAITLPARTYDGAAVTLRGRERTRVRDGMVEVRREADGDVGGSRIARSLARGIDPATGLVRDHVERIVMDTPAGPATVTRSAQILP